METPYIVSARKYRPQRFEAVVGQNHITATLENAIVNNHLPQALLFCGPRGVGKTTCARILARMINEHTTGEQQDYSLNIFELDAASNNSVDDIRNLIDQVRFAPQVGQYKVYIIDEVHMLSSSAFNAFLKTLEEPPAHAIFILATTEKHKIIPTILSRCQIFDFKRIGVEDIAKHLAFVAGKEGYEFEPEALHVIAQKADGALRDSLSIFDRMASFGSGKILYQDVVSNLNILDYDYYFKITDQLVAGQLPQALISFNEILEKGFDGHVFINGLASHFRDLLMAKDAATVQLLEVSDGVKARYAEQAKNTPVEFLVEGLKITAEADQRYKASNHPRLLVEVALIRILDSGNEKKKSESQPVKSVASPKVENKEEKLNIIASPAPAEIPVQRAPSTVPTPPQSTEVPKPQPVAKPVTPRALNTSGKRTTGFSLKSLSAPGQDKEETKEAELIDYSGDSSMPREIFTQHELNKAWEAYCESIIDRKTIYNTLHELSPKLEGKSTIQLTLDNQTKEGYLTNEKIELLGFMRKTLKNYDIDLDVTVNEQEESRSLYTPQEKYEHMVKKNPLLAQFRRDFDLDLE